MKAAATDGKGKVWLQEIPTPEPNDFQCLCRILACATCTGTDRKHIWDKLPWKQEYPGLLGHESVGEVVQVGRKVKRFRKGDVVLRPAAVYPGETLGGFSSMWGGFAEYGLVTDGGAVRAEKPGAEVNNYVRFQLSIPDSLGIESSDATMLVTLKETAGYVSSLGPMLHKSALVLGSGSVAYSMCRFAKIFGAKPVIVVGRRDEPLEYARKIGADITVNTTQADPVAAAKDATGGQGVDYLIDTTGDAELLKACMAALAPEGKAAPYATYPPADPALASLDPAKVRRGATGEDVMHEYLLDAVRLGLVRLADYYSHRMPFEKLAEGFEMLERKEAFKVVFEM